MNLALDLGTHMCRSLRGSRAGLVARRIRSMAAWLSDGATQRSWLERYRLPYFPCDGHLALIGDSAEELSQLFPVPSQDLLQDGSIPYSDAVTRQLIALLVEALLPPADADGDICCFSQPGFSEVSGLRDSDLQRRLEFTSRLVRLRGYEPCPVNPATAIALAEMEPERFTGIGICLGASGCDLVLTHLGNPAAVVRINRGGRWIDEELARRKQLACQDLFGQRVLDLETARRRKEAVSLTSPHDDEQKVVSELYRDLAQELVQGIEKLLAVNPLLVRFSQPLTIVLGGGTAQIAGFDEFLREEAERRLSKGILGAIRSDPGDELSVARGCLIQATLVAQSRRAA